MKQYLPTSFGQYLKESKNYKNYSKYKNLNEAINSNTPMSELLKVGADALVQAFPNDPAVKGCKVEKFGTALEALISFPAPIEAAGGQVSKLKLFVRDKQTANVLQNVYFQCLGADGKPVSDATVSYPFAGLFAPGSDSFSDAVGKLAEGTKQDQMNIALRTAGINALKSVQPAPVASNTPPQGNSPAPAAPTAPAAQ